VAGTGTHKGYYRRLHKNGETDYGPIEGTHKTTVNEDGSWEATWEGTWKANGGTGKFKNCKGSGTYRGKARAQESKESINEWEGEERMEEHELHYVFEPGTLASEVHPNAGVKGLTDSADVQQSRYRADGIWMPSLLIHSCKASSI